uniref:SDR family NAD(P)-dependent oxidoreductase n=1 Tax=Enterococcus faecium TaxID=1352 RepID=UPI0034E953B7
MDFKNKTVWITGALSGIGQELAIQLANLGANIILSARSVDKLEQLKTKLAKGDHRVIALDLAQPE